MIPNWNLKNLKTSKEICRFVFEFLRPFRIITVKFKTYKFYFSVPWRWTDRAHVTKRRIHGWIAKGFWIYVSLRNGGRTCILWSTIASKGIKKTCCYTLFIRLRLFLKGHSLSIKVQKFWEDKIYEHFWTSK